MSQLIILYGSKHGEYGCQDRDIYRASRFGSLRLFPPEDDVPTQA